MSDTHTETDNEFVSWVVRVNRKKLVEAGARGGRVNVARHGADAIAARARAGKARRHAEGELTDSGAAPETEPESGS